jgi:hypothetical protein
VAVAASEFTDGATAVAMDGGGEYLPYRIVFKLRSGCRLTGSLWSLSLVVAALPPRGVGYRAEREMLRTACVPVDRMNVDDN